MARPKAPVGAPREKPNAEHRERLEALRDRLEAAVSTAAHRDLAPLASRYQAVLAELAAMPSVSEKDGVDDLAARRAARKPARRSGSAAAQPPA